MGASAEGFRESHFSPSVLKDRKEGARCGSPASGDFRCLAGRESVFWCDFSSDRMNAALTSHSSSGTVSSDPWPVYDTSDPND